jgi:hypothetical protein
MANDLPKRDSAHTKLVKAGKRLAKDLRTNPNGDANVRANLARRTPAKPNVPLPTIATGKRRSTD